MTQTEMKDKFESLYSYMSASNEPRYMKLFGEVMVEMMDWMIKNQPTAAEQWIETLCAIKWEQYLTKSEALTVFNTLKPKGAWALDIWRKAMEDLVLDERQRELMFEGKRWYDLVRLSRRDGENDRLVKKVLPKFQENTSAIRIKLSTADVLYWPYNREEIKQNPKLVQNPAYITDNTEKNF
jgi:hypothetical protein